ncbi:hypothetical protein HK101_006052 [Irineochytrium annulatum]|nr:hypothetical protein HK101_006052 [Irineochytrium annulatum]
MALKCTNKGCGKSYEEDQNHDTACEHHAGGPVFHEGLKGWSCCSKRVVDFDDFLKIAGCAVGRHQHVEEPKAAPAAAQPKMAPNAVMVDGKEVYGSAPPKPAAAASPTVASNVATAPAAPEVKEEDLRDASDAVIEVGARCKRRGCGHSFEGPASRTGDCVFHSGTPIFHEGSKGWSCCSRKVLEFDEFLKIQGCKRGLHRFTDQGPVEERVQCRYDWYQTPTQVHLDIYAKKVDKSRTTVVFGEQELKVDIKFQDGKYFDFHTPLSLPITPEDSKFTVLSTKVTMVLKKANGLSWPSLEPPTKPITSWTTFGAQSGGGTQVDPIMKAASPRTERPQSEGIENLVGKHGHQQRPSSEVLTGHYKSPEAEAIDRWFEDLSYYERTLEQMARAKLDDNFREELKAIEQWFSVLSDPERTTALYSLLQHTTQVQIRFFITVLQQMAQKDPIAAVVSPGGAGAVANPKSGSSAAPSKGPGAIGSPVAPAGVVIPKVGGSGGPPSAGLDGELSGDDDKYVGMVPMTTSASRSSRRLYDRHSAPMAEEKYGILAESGRPKTPLEDVNWAMNGAPPGAGQPGYLLTPPTTERTPSSGLGMPGLGITGSTGGPLGGAGAGFPQQRSLSPRPVSPIIVSPPMDHYPGGSGPGVGMMANGARSPHHGGGGGHGHGQHPGDGWGHVSLGVGGQTGLRAPGSPGGAYAHSDYSDSYDDYGGDGGEHGETRSKGSHKEKGKIPEAVDLDQLNGVPTGCGSWRSLTPCVLDIPSWLRSLRLHKYSPIFEGCNWKEIIALNDDGLQGKGVSALGARRKLLKVFELVKAECDAKGISYV